MENPEDPRSFDRLDALLAQQPYVLSFWKVAREKVNYRRFFDIADLVGINVEDPEVFAATHSLIFQLVDEGWVTGLRVDHIDGLYDPSEYLRRLRERLPDCFIVVEKILEQQESLCAEWPVSGTTGYDFVNALGSTMVNPEGLERIRAAYQNAGGRSAFADVVYEERKHVIAQLFAGEAHSLSLHLNLLAESDRYAKDASPQELNTALVEVTACLPVYRTYTRSFQVRAQDLQSIDEAFRDARRLQSPLERNHLEFRPARVAARLSAQPRSRRPGSLEAIRTALAAVFRSGDGEGQGGYRLLYLQPADLDERSWRAGSALAGGGLPSLRGDPGEMLAPFTERRHDPRHQARRGRASENPRPGRYAGCLGAACETMADAGMRAASGY